MILLGFLGIMVAVPEFKMPAFTGWTAATPKGDKGAIFPLLFVTVACGACSGFHALVSSGTTSKQISTEKHILPVGYGGMLIEGLVALMALISVAILPKTECFELIRSTSAVSAFSAGLAGFTSKVGLPFEVGNTFIALTISAFMLTTLDTATRLTRFTWQELFLPRSGVKEDTIKNNPVYSFFSNPFVATLIIIIIAGYLASSGNAWQIWPVFGASNQLLAALTLLAVTLILIRKKKNYLTALLPMWFMATITAWALTALLKDNIAKNNISLVAATAFLLIMALILAGLAVKAILDMKERK
jgi:carbon starvation protein